MYQDAKGRYEYPPEHIGRKSYVTVQGFDYSVPKPYCFYHGGRWYLQGTAVEGDVAPSIMSDISPYWSPLSGEIVSSRSQRRNEIRAYGVLEVGNEPMRPFQPVDMNRPGHDIVRAMRR